MVGASLGDRFLLQEKIGQGGMGTVWRGFDSLLERPVAVKLLNPAGLATEGRARLLAEARAIARLDHPNIVSVYDAGESDGSPYIVMELVEGENLHDWPPAEFGQIVAIARQICAALEHAHGQGVVHRDLKPENVVIGLDGIARLMDFGLARSITSRLTQEGTIVGTVFYMAPEQALGDSVDGRADLYSLGVMLYELTTGVLPFTHDDPGIVISQHIHATPVPPRAKKEEIPPALSKLILALMSKDPKERPGSAAEVGRNLASTSILSMEAAPEDEPTALERIARGPVVGREREIELARGMWMKARGGEAQTLLISGEPGVGKSRLLRELVTHAELTGGRVIGAACYQEGAAPYAGFRQILREVFRGGESVPMLPAAVLPDLVSLVPELGGEFPNVSPHPPSDPHADQARLFESLTTLLGELARRGALLLYLDDAHWADSGTLSLLRHLVRSIQNKPFMVVLTYREQELDQALPLYEALLDIERAARAATMRVKPLPREQTRALLASIFQEEITEDFLDGIHRETEGNPFFIEEVCKALVESGKLYYRDGRWQRPSIQELGIPKNVRVAIQSRVNKLPAESQQVLKQAAVLGRAFDVRSLQLAAEMGQGNLLTALEDAERAQLIERTRGRPDSDFLFAHALIPSTLVKGLRIVERQRLHRQAASALEQTHPEASARLARHYQEAGDKAKAVEYLLRAGNEARLLHAHQEAISSYREAVDYYIESGDARRASSVLFRLALTHHNALEFERSHETYKEAFRLLQRASMTREAATAPAAPHPLRLALYEPLGMDPTRVDDGYSIAVIHQLFSGLVEERPDGGIVPDIAASWEVSEGGTWYVFHLRPDARWSNGESVTAGDFAFAWRRSLEPRTGFKLAGLLYDIKGARAYHADELSEDGQFGIQVLDDYTMVMELEAPVSYFLSILATARTFAVPKKVIEEHGDRWARPEHIVTSGPFRLMSWVEGKSMTLERRTDYPRRAAGNASAVEIRFYTDSTSGLLEEYSKGHLDLLIIGDMPIKEFEIARQGNASEYVSAPFLGTWLVYFDFRSPPFDDKRVRKAFAQAVDRESLANVDMHGLYSPATVSVVPPGIPGHFPEIVLPYDPDGARRLLAEAGFPEGSGFPPIRMRTSSDFMMGAITEALARQWRRVLGANVAVEALPWHDYLPSLKDDFPMLGFIGTSAEFLDPAAWFMEPAVPEVFWLDDRYEKLVQSARRAADPKERLDQYRAAVLILAEEVPYSPVLYDRTHFLVKPWLSSFPTSQTRHLFFKDVVIDPH
jgi:ABC-type oligopeptide transport system substrate-binding subunit/tetratricopeptide (TPR) repeat protein